MGNRHKNYRELTQTEVDMLKKAASALEECGAKTSRSEVDATAQKLADHLEARSIVNLAA